MGKCLSREVEYNPPANHSGWVGGWRGAKVFDATVLFIFPQGSVNGDTGEMKTVYVQEMLRPFAVILT